MLIFKTWSCGHHCKALVQLHMHGARCCLPCLQILAYLSPLQAVYHGTSLRRGFISLQSLYFLLSHEAETKHLQLDTLDGRTVFLIATGTELVIFNIQDQGDSRTRVFLVPLLIVSSHDGKQGWMDGWRQTERERALPSSLKPASHIAYSDHHLAMYHVAEADLELLIILYVPSECSDYEGGGTILIP